MEIFIAWRRCVYINSGKLFIPALHHQGHIAPLGQHSFSPGRKEGSKEGGAAGCCVNISFDWRRRSTAGHVTPTGRTRALVSLFICRKGCDMFLYILSQCPLYFVTFIYFFLKKKTFVYFTLPCGD